LAKILQLDGYSTAQFGKCHEVPVWETSPMGPYRQWPTGMGFEYFYGFLGGETNQYYPALYEGVMPVEPDKSPEDGYYFNDDLTSKATKWIRQSAIGRCSACPTSPTAGGGRGNGSIVRSVDGRDN
jgi:arylsulfatase A-like enzyme